MAKTKPTKSAIALVAAQYDTRTAFARGSRTEYDIAQSKGWLSDFFPKDSDITFQSVRDKLVKCGYSRERLEAESPVHFKVAKKRRWLRALGIAKPGPESRWDPEGVKAEASKYSSRNDFRLGSRGAYEYARAHGLLEDIGLPKQSGNNYQPKS